MQKGKRTRQNNNSLAIKQNQGPFISPQGFPGSTVVKNLPANSGGKRCGFDPWLGKIPWNRKWKPTPVFLLENPVDRGAWGATVHGVTKSGTQLSNSTHALHATAVDNILSCMLELFCRYWNPHQVGDVNSICSQAHKPSGWLEPKGWCCWLPITTPPTNQKNVHELTTHPNPLPHFLIFKNLSLKASREFGPFEYSSCQNFLRGTCSKLFPSPRPAVRDWLHCVWVSRPPPGGDPSTPAVVSAPQPLLPIFPPQARSTEQAE